MKRYLLLFCLLSGLTAAAQNQPAQPPATLKSILLAQFEQTWNKQDWFVPVSQAVDGLTAAQAMWKPSDSSHSVGQLAYHLWFWNQQSLDQFNGKKPAPFDGNNTETFNNFTPDSWAATVKQLNQVMQDWVTAIQQADEKKLQAWYSTIAHMSIHNAYHTGQILYIRKLAGNWDASKGVK